MKLFIVIALAVISASVASAASLTSQIDLPESRIINGHDAEIGEATYIVSLLLHGQHICGGSILSEIWILSAAHCLGDRNEALKVAAGHHFLDDLSNAQIRQVTKQIPHLLYTDLIIGLFDIGLIKVAEAFDFNSFVAPIALPNDTDHDTGDGELYGWGIDNSGNLSNTLQKLNVNIIGHSECARYLSPLSLVTPSNVCTRKSGTTDSACNGDSGGPLIRYSDNKRFLLGIVSWGTNPCGDNSHPTVYTRVSKYRDWIEDHKKE